MHTLLLAVDDPRRPSKSVLLSGPDAGAERNRKLFFEMKGSKANPSGLPWVQLWQAQGQQVASTPNKLNKGKDK